MKYVSHKVIYTLLPTSLQKMPDAVLDNYIIQCIRQINAQPLFENKICITKVENGVAELPDDFITAFGVFYNSKTPSESEFNSLLGCLCSEDITNGCISDEIVNPSSNTTTINNTVISDDVPIALQDRYRLVGLIDYDENGIPTTRYVLKNIVYNDYVNSEYFQNCWTPLFTSDRLFTQCFLTANSPCKIENRCNYRYSIDKCNHILTSMPNGWLKVAYTGRLIDKEGNFLIPDDMDYMRVLKDGVLMLYWEEKRTSREETGMQNHREYEIKFYNGVAALRGSSLLPRGILKDYQLRNIIYDKIRIANDYSLCGNSGWTGGSLYKNMRLNFN